MNKKQVTFTELNRDFLKDNNIKYVCIDYFGTMVHRSIGDLDVVRLWAKKLSYKLLEYGYYIDTSKLIEFRERANQMARDFTYVKNEPSYRMITDRILSFLGSKIELSKSTFFNISLETEIEVELSVQTLDEEMKQFINSIYGQCNIYIVSDFYLPKMAFVSFLKHHGILDKIDKIFVSSEVDARKDNGTMYKFLRENYIKSNVALMIGDNETSDVDQPKKAGMFACHRNKHFTDTVRYHNLVDSELRKLADNSKKHHVKYSFVLYLFIERLYKHVLLNKIKDIFFLSREGEFLKVLFDKYLEMNNNTSIVNTHYFCVSRKALSYVEDDAQQKINFNKYVDIQNLLKTGKVVLVDIGWKGTMQDILKEIFPDVVFEGYYLGVTSQSCSYFDNKKNGLIFSAYPQKSNGYDGFLYNNLIQEKLLCASHGSVLSYSEDGDPCFDDNKNDKESYKNLLPFRTKVYENFERLYHLFEGTGYTMEDYEEFCLREYLNDMVPLFDSNKGFDRFLLGIDKNGIDDKVSRRYGELNRIAKRGTRYSRLKAQLRILNRDNASAISYHAVLKPYFYKLHLGIMWNLAGCIVKQHEIHQYTKKGVKR